MKKTVIVDVVFANSVMWAEEWERGERGESSRVGQLLPDWGPGWMGILTTSKKLALQVHRGSLLICMGFDACILCEY